MERASDLKVASSFPLFYILSTPLNGEPVSTPPLLTRPGTPHPHLVSPVPTETERHNPFHTHPLTPKVPLEKRGIVVDSGGQTLPYRLEGREKKKVRRSRSRKEEVSVVIAGISSGTCRL